MLKNLEHSNTEVKHIRNRCAYLEKVNNKFGYYIFFAELDLKDIEYDDPILATKTVKTLFSTWIDWADKKKKVELRVASKIRTESAIHQQRVLLKEILYIINQPLDLSLWLFSWGGVALIREDLVRNNDYLSRWLSPYKNTPGWD